MDLLTAAQGHLRGNRLGEAEQVLRELIGRDPEDYAGMTLLGLTCFRLGRMAEAEELLATACRIQPDCAEAIGLLATVKRSRGDTRAAASLYVRLVSLGRGTADVLNQLGGCYLELGDPIEAGRAFKRAIETDRSLPHSYFNMGIALKQAGNSYETFATFKRAIELDPGCLECYVELWQQMRQLRNWNEGLPVMEKGLSRHPDSAKLKLMAAVTYGKVGDAAMATELFEEAARIDVAALPSYAHWLQEEGRFEDSVPLLKEAIRTDPVQGRAYYNLAMARCFEVDGKPLTEVVAPLMENNTLNAEEQMFLYYTLAKAYDRDKEYELAMRNYDKANDLAYKLYNSGIHHDEAATEEEQKFLRQQYSREHIERLQALGSKSPVPIFIVGMIRTGTTLLDQILSSHPQVRSAGEMPFWQVNAGRINRRWHETGEDISDLEELGIKYLQAMAEAAGLSPMGVTLRENRASRADDRSPPHSRPVGISPRLNRLGASPAIPSGRDPETPTEGRGDGLGGHSSFLSLEPALSPPALPDPSVSHITDKMPTNFMHVGLMSAVFPHSKFIHLRRNPMDTCLSIYTTFLGKGTSFAYNQENIVGYYRAYRRTMEHWRSVISSRQMIEIDYEDLVSDREPVLRRVVSFCGLDWDEACLRHEENTAQVSTPSLWAVRQPVNTGSVEKWRRYEPWLGKLIELKDLI